MLIKSLKDVPVFTAGDLTQIREVIHPKNDDIELPYSLAHASLATGTHSVPHILQDSSELYLILQGVGKIFIGDETAILKTGDTALVPAGERQHIENIGGESLQFLCVVSPAWSAVQEVIVKP